MIDDNSAIATAWVPSAGAIGEYHINPQASRSGSIFLAGGGVRLRQYALAGGSLIIDEAHCFDAYMKEELGALLRLHAMNGGSAIVLSATLARGIKQQIARSYYEGLGLTRNQAGKLAARCASIKPFIVSHGLPGKAPRR